MPGPHRLKFQQELADLESAVLGGIDLVVDQVDRVVEALDQHDVELAEVVIADDHRIDARYLE